MKRALSMLLAILMVVGLFAGCETKPVTTDPVVTDPVVTDPVVLADRYADLMGDYDALSAAIYESALSEYTAAYEAAKAVDNVSERYALMAIAEAKLLSSGVMLPLTSQGGNYAISRVAPYTAPNALWGNDSDRFHNVVVADKPISVADRDTMKAKWAELKTTGEYMQWAKDFLVENGYAIKDSYTFGYSSEPQTWDAVATSKAADSEAIVNTYDGLYEYDCEGVLQPALATEYTVTANEDGTVTYTFKIREGVKWVDAQGRELGTLTAKDFVSGMYHMLDAAGGLEYLVEGVIVNALEYNTGAITDVTQVGVKAIDDYTLEYTLCTEIPYFMTMLSYNIFAPVCTDYFVSLGGAFGEEWTEEVAAACTYGQDPNSIAYCGPYTVTNLTAKNTIVFTANPSYWNAENVGNKTITWLYNDGSDQLKAYNDTMSGIIDGAGLNESAVVKAKEDGVFADLAYVSSCDATTYFAFNNINRIATANFNDATIAVSEKTEEDILRARVAMYNQNFRLALCYALDRGAYNAQSVGDELKLTSLRNTYTPGNFVLLTEEVTVSINGEDKTYAAGTYYGQILQDQLDADGIEITAWDPTAEGGIGSSDGFDGWYSAEACQARLAAAAEELKAEGLEFSAENPIVIDLPYYSSNNTYVNRANAYKQSVEAASAGMIKVNLVACETSSDIYYAGYYISTGNEANYDVYDFAGWGPDYGDPQTYLDTILPEYVGYMTMMLGVY